MAIVSIFNDTHRAPGIYTIYLIRDNRSLKAATQSPYTPQRYRPIRFDVSSHPLSIPVRPSNYLAASIFRIILNRPGILPPHMSPRTLGNTTSCRETRRIRFLHPTPVLQSSYCPVSYPLPGRSEYPLDHPILNILTQNVELFTGKPVLLRIKRNGRRLSTQLSLNTSLVPRISPG
jgi:hypothetical protein